MSATHCDIHGLPWKIIPAGISQKTGQPYASFRRCQVDDCRARPPKPRQVAHQEPHQAPQDAPGSAIAPGPRSNHILASVAIKAACSFYAGSQANEEDALQFAAKIYRLLVDPASFTSEEGDA